MVNRRYDPRPQDTGSSPYDPLRSSSDPLRQTQERPKTALQVMQTQIDPRGLSAIDLLKREQAIKLLDAIRQYSDEK